MFRAQSLEPFLLAVVFVAFVYGPTNAVFLFYDSFVQVFAAAMCVAATRLLVLV